MIIPVYVVISQWAVLFGLGALVIVMYRHLGHTTLRTAHAGFGPQLGSQAGDFEYTALSDGSLRQFRPGQGPPALLAFVDPSCLSCEELVTTMDAAEEAGELVGLRPLLLVSEPPRYVQLSEAFRNTRLEIGRLFARTTLDQYKVSATPLLVAIGSDGVVRSAGPAKDIAEVRAAVQACILPAVKASLPVLASPPYKSAGDSDKATA